MSSGHDVGAESTGVDEGPTASPPVAGTCTVKRIGWSDILDDDGIATGAEEFTATVIFDHGAPPLTFSDCWDGRFSLVRVGGAQQPSSADDGPTRNMNQNPHPAREGGE